MGLILNPECTLVRSREAVAHHLTTQTHLSAGMWVLSGRGRVCSYAAMFVCPVTLMGTGSDSFWPFFRLYKSVKKNAAATYLEEVLLLLLPPSNSHPSVVYPPVCCISSARLNGPVSRVFPPGGWGGEGISCCCLSLEG